MTDFFVNGPTGQLRARLSPALGKAPGKRPGKRPGNKPGHKPDRRLLVLPGFCEFIEKYDDILLPLRRAGWQILVLDWPGQGLSGHLGRQPAICHIDDFDQHIAGLQRVLEQAGWLAGRFSILGHSMGGHLAVRAAHEWAGQTDGLVLSAPMFRPKPGPGWLIEMAAWLICLFGLARFGLPVGLSPEPPAAVFNPDNRLTRDPAGWLGWVKIVRAHPSLWRGGPSFGWLQAAYKSCRQTSCNPRWLANITTPCLALLAGDERLVSNQKTLAGLRAMQDARHICFAAARHELLLEEPSVRAEAYDDILAFLAETAS